MGDVRNYRDLEAWQVAMEVATLTYALTADLPPTERFGLSAQMRRAAASIPSNIAEGQARRSPRVFGYFIGIALGSCGELDTQLEIAIRLGYVTGRRAEALQTAERSVRQLLFGLSRAQQLLLIAAVTAPMAPALAAIHRFG